MGYIEFIDFDEDGVTVTPWDKATAEMKLDAEISMFQGDIQVLCFDCYKPIPSGTGAYCDTHRPKNV